MELARRGYELQPRLLGKDHIRVASAANDLGAVYYYGNKLDEAVEYNINLQAFGSDDVRTANSSTNLAMQLLALGKFEPAEQLQRKVIPILEKNLGADHPQLATELENLGNIISRMGRFDESLHLASRALRYAWTDWAITIRLWRETW